MKAVTATFALSLLTTAALFAQEQAPAPEPAPAPETPFRLSLPGSPTAPGAANENLGLIPETPEPTTKPKGTAIPEAKPSRKAADSPNKTSIAEDEMAARVRLRQLKTRVLADPKIQQLLERARTSKTDYERREAMKAFYNLFYGKIEKLDGSLKKRVAALRNTSIHRLDQTRIDPTEPIDPNDRAVREERPE